MRKFTFLFILLSTIFVRTRAVDLTSDSIKSTEIKGITVFGGLPKMMALPIVIVDVTALQSKTFFTPADILQRETGISLSRDGIWATSVNVRGFSEQRLLLLVDGDRIQSATDIAAALSTVDMNSLEKIEVIKGASSVLYGTGAMGGVVNFVSERPTYSSSFQTKGSIGTEFNSANSLWSNNGNIQFTSNQWYLSLNGSFRTAQNIQTPQGVLPNSQFNDDSWALKGGIMYTPNQELLLNYQHFGGWDIGLPGGSAFPSTASVRYRGVERNQLSAEYIISNINNRLREVRFKAYTQNMSRDVENIVNQTTTLLPMSLNRTYGVKATTDWHLTDYHTLVLGGEAWERKAETSRLKLKTTSDSTYTVFGEQPTPNAQMLDVGAFAHYSWKIVPRKWTLNAGLRFDYIQTTNDTTFNPIFQYSVNKGLKTNEINLLRNILFLSDIQDEMSYAAHIDLVYNPTKQQQLGFSLSNSYRTASIEERFKYIDQAGILRVGNPKLKPEKGIFSNLSYMLSGDYFHLKVDVFANYLIDLITEKSGTYNYLNANGTNTSINALVNTNVNKALFLGAEAEADWKITNHFSFKANASYTRATDIDSNTFLPQIPPLHGYLSLNYQSKKQFNVSFSSLWAAPQNEVSSTEIGTEGHVIFNFDIHSEKNTLKNSYLQLFGGVDNIFDTAYFNHLSTTRGILRLEPGRNIYLKVKWGWQ